ncbi:MAG: PepSY-associated TM helix domain-containing protein, partial [Zoogloeaceae bacterium]|nr:PepSY-associated TM helix domain-containing protein [Zoogloeaceae bacterium]
MPTYAPPRHPTSPAPSTDSTPSAPAENHKRRAVWLRTLHQWHWISSAICLFGMFLFAVTGITLNHAGAIEARA